MALTHLVTNMILTGTGTTWDSPEISMAGANSISVQVNTTQGTTTITDLKYEFRLRSGSAWSDPIAGTDVGTVKVHVKGYSTLQGAASVQLRFTAATAGPFIFDVSVNTYSA